MHFENSRGFDTKNMKNRFALLAILLILCPLRLEAQAQRRGKSSLKAEPVGLLDAPLKGSSSLFYMDGKLWSCADHGRLVLYALDSATAQTVDSIDLGVSIYDMEEVTLDSSYLYFGDFGNNGSGGFRTDLRILRLDRSLLPEGPYAFDTIAFSYPDWDSAHAADFDCEAFVVDGDSLYLFTKQWTSEASAIYALPRLPGTHVATPRGRLAVEGLVTGACYRADLQLLTLIGYTSLCKPIVYLAYGFRGTQFDGGSVTRIALSNGFGTQTEGIASADARHYFVTNEYLSRYGITQQARLSTLNLNSYVDDYLNSRTPASIDSPEEARTRLFPNPTTGRVTLPLRDILKVEVFDTSGRQVLHLGASTELDLGNLPEGDYVVRVQRHCGITNTYIVIKQ